MQTISSQVDDRTAELVAQTVKLEDRNRSQIAAAALRWYIRLSPSARDAMRRIEASGEQAVDEAAWAVGRTLLERDYAAALGKVVPSLMPKLPADASEEQIMAEAVRLTVRD